MGCSSFPISVKVARRFPTGASSPGLWFHRAGDTFPRGLLVPTFGRRATLAEIDYDLPFLVTEWTASRSPISFQANQISAVRPPALSQKP